MNANQIEDLITTVNDELQKCEQTQSTGVAPIAYASERSFCDDWPLQEVSLETIDRHALDARIQDAKACVTPAAIEDALGNWTLTYLGERMGSEATDLDAAIMAIMCRDLGYHDWLSANRVRDPDNWLEDELEDELFGELVTITIGIADGMDR